MKKLLLGAFVLGVLLFSMNAVFACDCNCDKNCDCKCEKVKCKKDCKCGEDCKCKKAEKCDCKKDCKCGEDCKCKKTEKCKKGFKLFKKQSNDCDCEK